MTTVKSNQRTHIHTLYTPNAFLTSLLINDPLLDTNETDQ